MHCPALHLSVRKGRGGGYTAGGPGGEERDFEGDTHWEEGKDMVGGSNTSAIFILAPGSLYPLFATLLFLSR